MPFQNLFSVMWRCAVTAPGFMLGIVLDVLIDKSVVLFFKVRPPAMFGLNTVLSQNFPHAVDA